MYLQTIAFSEQNRLINMLASYGIKDPVLSLFKNIPRSHFLSKSFEACAYEDRAFPISSGQTNSQPSLTAMTLQTLGFEGHERVLEIGTGSGFQTAMLSWLAKEVVSIEIVKKLGDEAMQRLEKHAQGNVKIVIGDGTQGFKKKEPYDVVIVNAASENIPQALRDQLKEGGKLVMPLGNSTLQELNVYKKIEGELVQIRKIASVKFVPLV